MALTAIELQDAVGNSLGRMESKKLGSGWKVKDIDPVSYKFKQSEKEDRIS